MTFKIQSTLAVPSTEPVARKLLLDGKNSIERIHVLWLPRELTKDRAVFAQF